MPEESSNMENRPDHSIFSASDGDEDSDSDFFPDLGPFDNEDDFEGMDETEPVDEDMDDDDDDEYDEEDEDESTHAQPLIGIAFPFKFRCKDI
jgi:hypothetical protein